MTKESGTPPFARGSPSSCLHSLLCPPPAVIIISILFIIIMIISSMMIIRIVILKSGALWPAINF